jgi:hypothetical protein
MLSFLNRSGTSKIASAVLGALASSNLPAGVDPARLRVAESRGSYAGRKVTYFRVFDPRQVDGHSGKIGERLSYQDLEPYLALVLGAGYVEEDGTVMLNRVVTADARTHASDPGSTGPARVPADRAAHPDDAHLIIQNVGR